MKKIGKLLALCLALMSLIVCMALAGCKKTPDSETGGDSATTTTAEQGTSVTTEINVGEEGQLPGDDDVVIEIEGTTSSSSVASSKSSGSTTKGSSRTSASQNQSSENVPQKQETTTTVTVGATKSRTPGETPLY